MKIGRVDLGTKQLRGRKGNQRTPGSVVYPEDVPVVGNPEAAEPPATTGEYYDSGARLGVSLGAPGPSPAVMRGTCVRDDTASVKRNPPEDLQLKFPKAGLAYRTRPA